jgi:hypothetical protein
VPDQARWAPLLVVLALPACTERINELNPVPFFDNLFNASHLQGREPPPGLDGPWPNLSSVPPRPEPPDPATRARVSAGLAEDRQQSRTPLGVMPGSRPAASDPGSGPPPPPRLAAVPPLRLEPVPAPQPAPAAAPVVPQPAPAPAAPAPVRAPEPAAPPPAPAPALLAPPPPPGRDLLAPPPPPNPDLLAPRRN